MNDTLLNLVQLIISVLLIVTILVQVRGQGTGLFGSSESSFRTRRGIELTLFRFTVFLVVVFIGVSIISVRFF
ncbi:MAG: preprotein translocase subunit SecG [Chloroflexi bacterium]|nr:preprotein translocase subunit SecG [Chloroflexota bacterium]